LLYDFCQFSNEKDVGRGIKKSGIPRSDIFVVTKLWGDSHGYENCKAAFANSLKKYAFTFIRNLYINLHMIVLITYLLVPFFIC